MGLLRKGNILSWKDLERKKEIIKNRGISQFIKVYSRNKSKITSTSAFGEEIELMILKFSDNKYKLFCGSESIIGKADSTFVEYARYMVEISSVVPYEQKTLRNVEKSILQKIVDIENIVDTDIFVLMMPCYPHMNYSYFYDTKPLTDDTTLSLHFPDNAITNHKRFESFTRNIRNRRGRKVEGYIEVMEDKHTLLDNSNKYITIDSMGQGMGCCCLQVTMQGECVDSARYIYDMMGVLSPLLLRITRGTPCANGKLLRTETRWEMLEISVDCRTDLERGFNSIISSSYTKYPYESGIPKSRFSPIDLFISTSDNFKDKYNDINVPIHQNILQRLLKSGIDERLSKHVASLFIRDPMVSYEETNEDHYDDFENIQSSNWRSVRFKIPTESSEKKLRGWKVEVRPMEVQATAFENTAFVYFTYLLSQAIVKFNLNFYIPISKIDTNFIRANEFIRHPSDFKNKLGKDEQLFYYRSNIEDPDDDILLEGTIEEIFMGKGDYKGIIYYVKQIIEENFNEDREFLIKYVQFIEDKITNKYISLSDWIRKFVLTHSDYKNDSILTDTILNDLIKKMIDIRKENSVDYLINE
ncbi:hypothetical protein P3W45_001431 [Vairimorpha bombi]|jgi:glutamate--cysteine ligase catalytic subunit